MATLDPATGIIIADGDYDTTVSGATKYNLNIVGDFGSGTVVVKEQNVFDKTEYAPYATASPITSNFTRTFTTRPGATIRITLAGSTNPDLFAHLTQIK